jgi:FKBP-type peptidyl-prolyl cis-trans isomerase SlyD
MVMSIEDNKVVTLEYTVTATTGEVIDSSEGTEPLVYLHGAQNIVPGLENALAGKTVDDAFVVTVVAADAYGEKSDEMMQQVPASAFEGVDDVEVGMEFHADTPQGPMPIIVTAVEDDMVTVDANHPLAGRDLIFDVKITDVRDATEEELENGHIHGPGCDH